MQRSVIVGGLLLASALAAFPTAGQAQFGTFLGKDAPQWENALTSGDAKARRSAAFALGKLGKLSFSSVGKLLDTFNKDSDDGVKEAAAFAIGEICKSCFNTTAKSVTLPAETEKILSDMRTTLANNSAPELVRRSAAYTLGSLGKKTAFDAKCLEALDGALTSTSPAVKQAAAWALGETGPSGVKSLIKALGDSDPVVIRSAAKALVSADTDLRNHPEQARILATLVPKIGHADMETRKAVVLALTKVAKPGDSGPLVEPLKALLTNSKEDDEVKLNAAVALANTGGAQAQVALPVLLGTLKGSNPALRRAAAAVIGNIGKPAVVTVPDLVAALKDADPVMREYAATSLGGIGAALNPLTKENMNKPEDPERSKVTDIIPNLIEVLDDAKQPFDVRKAAVIALKEIGPAKDGTEKVLNVLVKTAAEKSNGDSLRAFALWPVRFYKESESNAVLLSTLNQILNTEAPSSTNKDLRYDSAYLLAKYEKGKVSEKVLDTLLEFLKDDQVFIATGTGGVGSGVAEGIGGKGSVNINKGGDGRIIAVAGIRSIINDKFGGNSQRVLKRMDIMTQLRSFLSNPKTDPNLQKSTKEVVEYLSS